LRIVTIDGGWRGAIVYKYRGMEVVVVTAKKCGSVASVFPYPNSPKPSDQSIDCYTSIVVFPIKFRILVEIFQKINIKKDPKNPNNKLSIT